MLSAIVIFFKSFDILRKIIINLLFWGIIAALLFFAGKNLYIPDVEEGTILHLDISGIITEESSYPGSDFMGTAVPGNENTSLKDLLKTLDAAADDDKIAAVLLDLRSMRGAGLVKLQETGRALAKVRNAGKKIVAYSNSYSQGMYYLASHADTVIVDPLGSLFFTGFGSYKSYYGKGLEKFGIEMNVFRTGDNKNAVEPYLREQMSDLERATVSGLLDFLWKEYTDGIIAARPALTGKKLFSYINDYPRILARHGGDSAAGAVEYSLVDKTGFFEDAVKEAGDAWGAGEAAVTGTRPAASAVFGPRLKWKKYLASVENSEKERKDRIAVVIASGSIVPGVMPPGMIGGDTYSRLIEKAGTGKNVKALVLRIDSGGGSVYASEQIRRAVQQLRDQGVPVVVSVSSAAASGGYWISTAADEVWALPSAVTGSIGVFAVIPDFSKFLEKYPGIKTDGYGTTPFSHMYRPDMEMNSDMKKVFQLSIDNNASYFQKLIKESRNLESGAVDKFSDGRALSGAEALALGLVDRLGFFDEAVASAALLGGTEDYTVDYYEPEEDLMMLLSRGIASVSGRFSGLSGITGSGADAADAADAALAESIFKSWMMEAAGIKRSPDQPVIYSQFSFNPVIY